MYTDMSLVGSSQARHWGLAGAPYAEDVWKYQMQSMCSLQAGWGAQCKNGHLPLLFPEPLLFITVLEALSHEFHTGCPWENLYADDLVIISESLE